MDTQTTLDTEITPDNSVATKVATTVVTVAAFYVGYRLTGMIKDRRARAKAAKNDTPES